MSRQACEDCGELIRVIEAECSRPGLEGCREWDVECGCGDIVSVITEDWQLLTAEIDDDGKVLLVTSLDANPEIL